MNDYEISHKTSSVYHVRVLPLSNNLKSLVWLQVNL